MSPIKPRDHCDSYHNPAQAFLTALSASNIRMLDMTEGNYRITTEADKDTAGEGPPARPLLSPPYSVFRPAQKRWIIFIAAWARWFSTASSLIYFPTIPFMAHDMGVSIQKINLTVTSYMIASGIFPAITGNAADRYGRRIILLASLAVYTTANISIAVQRSFAALLMLRMLQSAAISGMIMHPFAYDK